MIWYHMKVKWSIETNDVDNNFLRDYENMRKLMEDRQINDFYEARRHTQSAMMGDTPVKTVQNSVLITCLIMIVSTIEFLSHCATD